MNSTPFRTDPSPVVQVDPAKLRDVPREPATCRSCGYLISEPRRHVLTSQTCARAPGQPEDMAEASCPLHE